MNKEQLISGLTRTRYHHPKYSEEPNGLLAEPYLHLPFRQDDLLHWQIRPSQIGITQKIDYEISEGWFYSRDIKRLVPYSHMAADFSLPYGFPIAAPCDGFAMSSYYSHPILDKAGNITKLNGKMLNFGIGYFVQIYNPSQNRFVQLGHLSDISEKVPFSVPTKVKEQWMPINNIQTPKEIVSIDNQNVVFVKTGEIVGFLGYSGLTDGIDYFKGYERPYKIDRTKIGTLSIPHVHMDEFFRNYKSGAKEWRRDLYDIYKQRDSYPTHTNNNDIGNEPIFLTDENDRPHFADR